MKRINLSSTVISLLSTTVLCTMFLAASSDACAKTLYLQPGVWETGSPKYAIYYYEGDNNNGWSSYMTSVDEDTYSTTIPEGNWTVIFCRMNPNGGINWDGRWDQTQDLTIPSGKDMYVISAFGVGTNICPGEWATYSSDGNSGGTDPVTPTDYASAVPNQCTDVMLQAFYWNSNSDNTYGTSQWSALKNQAGEISTYFDLVWLPPSCNANDDMGYMPKEYHNQNSKMGQKAMLNKLITALHTGGARVLADVVINHAANKGSWIDFMDQDFGEFGKFEPRSWWITRNDEAHDKGYGPLSNNDDDGQNGSDANFGSARDWDHKTDSVQKMCKAYLKFLKNKMHYDGYRFDYSGGYHVSHTRDYLADAKPYFSVMEYWNGDPNHLKARIDDANKATLTFDFAAYYTALRDGIAKGSYDKCKAAGLRGKGYSKYAVHFVDNHDTFNRKGQTDNPDVGGSKDGYTTLHNRALMLQCNAYILSMPGVPCVFWPHWYTYKTEIKKMIEARKKAAIHSESTIEESSGSGWYKATVHGKAGNVILYLGTAASETAPSGYKTAIKEDKVAMYYTGEGWNDVEQVIAAPKSEKFLKDGQLYIRRGEKIYDAQGRIVK